MNRPLLHIGILFLLLLGSFSCHKEGESKDTIVLMGEEKYVKELKELITIDSLKNKFTAEFGDMPEGLIPPNIEGEYFIDSLQLLSSNYAITENASEIHLEISRQHNRVAAVQLYQGTPASTDTAYIMGSGDNNRFTLYLTERKEIEFQGAHFSVKRFVVFSGEKTPGGIRDLKYGSIVLDSDYQLTPVEGPFTPGAYFIYRDADGFSENDTWFLQQEEGDTL